MNWEPSNIPDTTFRGPGNYEAMQKALGNPPNFTKIWDQVIQRKPTLKEHQVFNDSRYPLGDRVMHNEQFYLFKLINNLVPYFD